MGDYITYSADNIGINDLNLIYYKDNGSIVSTSINREIELHEKIQKMEEQIAQLERAVKILSARIQ